MIQLLSALTEPFGQSPIPSPMVKSIKIAEASAVIISYPVSAINPTT